eukprot:TRINITY_DN5435_c0_g1_i1.p1 TRINITY_DN5435_c0_g1~~TRINITY_DN5435_c0_g1_i1.p1  ORF type:complete len:625 (+),score=198.62 TRINITY_DN5435_c0_g1_i1:170-2044(+)
MAFLIVLFLLSVAVCLALLFCLSKRIPPGIRVPPAAPSNHILAHYALIVRDAVLFDGLGSAPRPHVDVCVGEDGRVQAIVPHGELSSSCDREVHANGLWLVPGLLDIHCHYDAEIEACGAISESLRHGVTSVLIGNCSLSASIGSDTDLIDIFSRVENLPSEVLETWLKNKVTWRSVTEYYEHVDTLPLGINVATFLGHSALRIHAMGLERSLAVHEPSTHEMQTMERVLREALDAGYLGLSIDMLPWHRMSRAPHTGVSVPSQQARYAEYWRLSNVVREYGRVLQATPSAADLATALFLFVQSSGVLFSKALRTTVLAAMDVKVKPAAHHLAGFASSMFNNLLGCLVRLQVLSTPFLLYSDGLMTPISEELNSGCEAMNVSPSERKKMFADASFRRRFANEWKPFAHNRVFHCDLSDMWVVDAPDSALVGKSFAEIAVEKGQEPIEYFMDALATHGDEIRWKTEVANHRPAIRRKLLAHPHLLPGFNDSGAHNRNMAFHDGGLAMLAQSLEHPDWLPFESALVRLTSEPAQFFGIDRGTIAVGAVADMTLLDADALRAHDFAREPSMFHDPALGVARLVKRTDGVVHSVFVGGEVVMEAGVLAPELGAKKFGQVLRSTHRPSS